MFGIHSKNTGVKHDPEKGLLHIEGQTPFRVNDDPEISQLDAEYDPELVNMKKRKLTKFRVAFDPELSMTPMDPFPGQAGPGVFRVSN